MNIKLLCEEYRKISGRKITLREFTRQLLAVEKKRGHRHE